MKRIDVLDVWRSLCVWIMVVYHALYDLILFGQIPAAVLDNAFADLIAFVTAGVFVLLGGVVSRFSRDTLRRGFRLFCLGLVVSVAGMLVGQPIAFGILQLFGLCMMGYSLCRERLDKVKGKWLPLLYAGLFVSTVLWTNSVTVSLSCLYPLGFRAEGFYSADYFPLLPWAFLFLLGTRLGGVIAASSACPLFTRRYPRWLTFSGRHSLFIYLLHQPLLFALFSVIYR